MQLYKQHFAAGQADEEDDDGDGTGDGEEDGKEGGRKRQVQLAASSKPTCSPARA